MPEVSSPFSLGSRRWNGGSTGTVSSTSTSAGSVGATRVTYSFPTVNHLCGNIEAALPNTENCIPLTNENKNSNGDVIMTAATLQRVEDGIHVWENFCNLRFTKVADSGGAINAANTRGDLRVSAHTFNGPGGVLAHAYFPSGSSVGGDVHFDAFDQAFFARNNGDAAFLIMAHEVGHAIGLQHTDVNPSLMEPFINLGLNGPQPDDIKGCQAMYGACFLSATITDNAAMVVTGGTVTYTITITNNGPNVPGSTDPAAVLTIDFAPGLTCTTSSVTNGGTITSTPANILSGQTGVTGTLAGTLSIPGNGANAVITATCALGAGVTSPLQSKATIKSSLTDTDASDDTQTDSTTVIGATPNTDIAITKTRDQAVRLAGENIVYTIVARNNGPNAAPTVTLADTFPAGVTGCTYTTAATGAATVPPAQATAQTAFSDSVSMPVGSTVTYTVTCQVLAGAGVVSNTATATVTGAVTDIDGSNNSATASFTVSNDADVEVTVVTDVPVIAMQQSVAAGSSLEYTVRVTNKGPASVATVGVTDDLSNDGLRTCTWTGVVETGTATLSAASGTGGLRETITTMANGAVVVYTIDCNIPNNPSGATAPYTVTLSPAAARNDPVTTNDQASVTVALVKSVDMVVSINDGNTGVIQRGSTFETEFTVQSNGPSTADAIISAPFNDAAFESCLFSVTTAQNVVGIAPGATAIPGTAITFTDNTSKVVVKATCKIDTTTANVGGQAIGVSVTATVQTGVQETNTANNVATDNDQTAGLSSDASATITRDKATVLVDNGGNFVTYTAVYTNNGPDEDPLGYKTETTLPSVLNCVRTFAVTGGATGATAGNGQNHVENVKLPVSATVTYTFKCSVPASTKSSTASARSKITALTATAFNKIGNNDQNVNVQIIAQRAEISVAATATGPVVPGASTPLPRRDQVTYTTTVSNAGPDAAAAQPFTGTFDARLTCSWTLATQNGASSTKTQGTGNIAAALTLPAGSAAVFTTVCTAKANVPFASLTHTALVQPTIDTNAADNGRTVTILSLPEADLGVSITDNVINGRIAQTYNYVIVAVNNGPSDADVGAALNVKFDTQLTCTSKVTSTTAGATTDTPNANGTPLAASLTLPAGGRVEYTATCTINANSPRVAFQSTASIARGPMARAKDLNAANNNAIDLTEAFDSTSVSLKIERVPLRKRDEVTQRFLITATNTGPVAAPVTDVTVAGLPATGTRVVTVAKNPAMAPDATLDVPTGVVTWNAGVLAAGVSATITVDIVIDPLQVQAARCNVGAFAINLVASAAGAQAGDIDVTPDNLQIQLVEQPLAPRLDTEVSVGAWTRCIEASGQRRSNCAEAHITLKLTNRAADVTASGVKATVLLKRENEPLRTIPWELPLLAGGASETFTLRVRDGNKRPFFVETVVTMQNTCCNGVMPCSKAIDLRGSNQRAKARSALID